MSDEDELDTSDWAVPPMPDHITIAALRDEVYRWRNAMSYFVGAMAYTDSPEACRAEGFKRICAKTVDDA